MPARLAAFCRETGQPAPDTPGACVRCALESLALQYRRTLREAEAVTGRTVRRLHLVGGGSRNALLNRLTAAACGVPVHAGPAEATALGNALVQALTAGALPDVAAARELVARSFPPEVFLPENPPGLDAAVRRFEALGAA
ncbi:MAG TPA: FGGY-family carbohydrate kinase, partial [Verrucomicrobiota bacterium]|nr:FGGY-family carbohydrate kinase [Verrucomicrobiota bacterium]